MSNSEARGDQCDFHSKLDKILFKKIMSVDFAHLWQLMDTRFHVLKHLKATEDSVELTHMLRYHINCVCISVDTIDSHGTLCYTVIISCNCMTLYCSACYCLFIFCPILLTLERERHYSVKR